MSVKENFAVTSDGYDAADTRKRVKAILVGSIGNLIEWYDVYAYSAFALYSPAPSFRKAIRRRSSWPRPRCSPWPSWSARSAA